MKVLKRRIFNILKFNREKFPRLLSIELSNLCNSNCIMCPRSELTRKVQNMPFDILEKIVNDCKILPLKKINLFWFGDSLCNKDFIECLIYIRKNLPKVRLYLSTNGELLSEGKSMAIIDGNLLDVINFDIDGVKKETYESIRRGVSFEKVINNVHYFIDYKKKMKKRKPQIRVTIINMKPTVSEIPEFVKYWEPLVNKVDVNDYNTWLGTQIDLNVGEKLKESQEGEFTFACEHPWEELVISADGLAGLCCLDYDLKAQVGDTNTQSIKEIWNGDKLNYYRNKHINLEYDDINICKNCNAFIYQKNKTWARLQS